jgi:hypothetical protein
MNDRTAGAILLVIGVVAIFAAIVGGGIKIQQIEVGSVQSKWRQWLLAAFGLIIGVVGLIMALGDSPEEPATNVSGNEVTNSSEATADDQDDSDANTIDENTDSNLDSNAADQNDGDTIAGDAGTGAGE